jgi:hypothetical protein
MGGGSDKPKSPDQSEPDVATRIMERMVRMPPKQHKDMKLGKRRPVMKFLRASSFLFDGDSVVPLKNILKRLEDRGFNGSLLNCHLDVSKPVERCPTRLASDNDIVGWAVQTDGDGRSALVAFDADFNVVVDHR